MKFLFIVQGEGRGHISQAIALSQILNKNNHVLVCSLIGKSRFRKVPDYFFNKINSPYICFDSPNFIRDKKNKQIKIFLSFIYNIIISPSFFYSIFIIKKAVKKYKPDIIINFYDIIGGLYNFIYRPKCKFICIGHQYFMQHTVYQMPDNFKISKFLLNTYTKLTSLKAYKKIGLSLYPANDCIPKKIYISPPLIRAQILNNTGQNKDFFLIYLLNAGYINDIAEWHKKHDKEQFYIFIDDSIPKNFNYKNDNFIIKKLEYDEYIKIFISCKGVITNAGFETPAEAIYLGKPLLIKPAGNHFEQLCNANDIKKLGVAMVGTELNIDEFIKFSEKYIYNPYLIKWISSGNEKIIDIITKNDI